MFRFLFALLPVVLFTACYEDNISCLDPDATNYDILADEACPDCCTYPAFSLDVDRKWGTADLSLDSTYQDGAGNPFKLLRFRTYLSELVLATNSGTLPTPENAVEVDVLAGTDTVLTTINANLVLLKSAGTTASPVGRLRVGTEPLTQLSGTVGLGETFAAVYPVTAPASSPLATQAGLLNFNDGQGYLSASAEYLLLATNDTVRVDVRGLLPFTLNFPGPLEPLRGINLTLELEADYQQVFGTTDLSASETTVASALLNRLGSWLRVVGAR